MMSAFLLGGASTYGIYKGFSYLQKPSQPNFHNFLRYEDVRSTIATVQVFLKKKKKGEHEQLRAQLKLIEDLLRQIDDLVRWRTTQYVRYFAYTGETKLQDKFREEWIIFKVRIRVLSGLNYLDFFN